MALKTRSFYNLPFSRLSLWCFDGVCVLASAIHVVVVVVAAAAAVVLAVLVVLVVCWCC
jgi:hypothetical protein